MRIRHYDLIEVSLNEYYKLGRKEEYLPILRIPVELGSGELPSGNVQENESGLGSPAPVHFNVNFSFSFFVKLGFSTDTLGASIVLTLIAFSSLPCLFSALHVNLTGSFEYSS